VQQQHVHGAFAQMAALAHRSTSVDEMFGAAAAELVVSDAQQQHVHDAFAKIGAHVEQHGGGLLGLVVGLES
jgi:hypothetical protein